jgi:hypothetical protein
MKAFCFIFVFQILLLAAQPCTDLAAVTAARAVKASTVSTQKHRSDTDKKNDCPPLCICSCSGMAAAPNIDSGIQHPTSEANIATPRVLATYHSLISTFHRPAIWQPPKI